MTAHNPALAALVSAFGLEVESDPAPTQKATDGDLWPENTLFHFVPDDAPAELHNLAEWGRAARWFLPRSYNRTGWTVNHWQGIRDLRGLFEARLSFAASRRIFAARDDARYRAAVADMQTVRAIVG